LLDAGALEDLAGDGGHAAEPGDAPAAGQPEFLFCVPLGMSTIFEPIGS
jgi:hypothetical protein